MTHTARMASYLETASRPHDQSLLSRDGDPIPALDLECIHEAIITVYLSITNFSNNGGEAAGDGVPSQIFS